MIHQNETGGECGMAAQVDFDLRGKPAQLKPVAGADEICGLREVIFRGDRLQLFVVKPGFERTDGRGVAPKKPSSECIHLIERDFHAIKCSELYGVYCSRTRLFSL